MRLDTDILPLITTNDTHVRSEPAFHQLSVSESLARLRAAIRAGMQLTPVVEAHCTSRREPTVEVEMIAKTPYV